MLPTCSAGILPAVSQASSLQDGEVLIRNRGYLPHWQSPHAIYSVIFRLSDSLPASVLDSLHNERDIIFNAIRKAGRELSLSERLNMARLIADSVDTYLDQGAGSCVLADPRAASIVANALRFFDGERYRLHAWCVMPNHVHGVFEPHEGHALDKILHSWKSFTANEINKALKRSGTLWQRESYDHLVRDERDFDRAVEYVANNPAKAGLIDWEWVGVG
jgi:REP element-mobilizing transposase RayT